jgi:hypothetical protein
VGVSDEDQFLLATLPPSNRQIRLALGVIAALVVAVLIIAPFANIRLPQLGTFFPVLLTVVIVNDLITSALLLSQFFVVGRMALFVLAISYYRGWRHTVTVGPDGYVWEGNRTAQLISEKSRRDVVSNQLVLVVPREHPVEIEIKPGFDLSGLLGPTGRLAVGDPAHVPAGRYAKQALVKLGAWDFVRKRLAPSENVRSALFLVERGEPTD